MKESDTITYIHTLYEYRLKNIKKSYEKDCCIQPFGLTFFIMRIIMDGNKRLRFDHYEGRSCYGKEEY